MHVALFRAAKRCVHTTAPNARGAVAHPGWFPRDHQPGPYPKTEEERRAAAIKYGLRPEDYKPHHPADEWFHHIGDYPNVEVAAYDQRDPYEPYSHPLHRRNWNEPVPRMHMRYRMDRWSYTGLDEEHFEQAMAIKHMLTVLLPMLLIGIWIYRGENDKLEWLKQYIEPSWTTPVMPKQYQFDYYRAFPFDDPTKYPILNYTFEQPDEASDAEADNARFPFNETSNLS